MNFSQLISQRSQSLPQERVAPVQRRTVWLTLGGAVALLLAANLAMDGLLTHFTTNRGYFLTRRKWELLANLQQPVDWLVLGDSSCNQGVVPEILSDRLGGTALNLCTFGPMLSLDNVWMLEQHIQQVGAPRHVLIVQVYDIWHREIDEESISLLAQIPDLAAKRSTLKPALSLNQEDETKLFLHRYAPLYSASETLEDWIREPLASYQYLQKFTLTDSGFMPFAESRPAEVRADTERHREFVQKERFQVSDINQRSLHRLRQLAETHGIEVYFASSPLYAGLYADPDLRAYYRQMYRWLEDFVASSDRLHLILEDPVTFEAHQMQNADHVTPAAAAIYTERLAVEILNNQSGSR
ncbi:MAG: hypothetical protein VKK04_15460 [Synechococcales bacterium]|nr:hypothetical protein [Synechococcales bacterium]